LKHYHLDRSDDTVIHLQTRGIQAPKHATFSLLAQYPDANVVTIGGMYFETRKFFDRLKYMLFQGPDVLTISEPNPEVIRKYILKAAESNKPTIVLADPIESFDLQKLENTDFQKVMRLHQIQTILETAAQSFKGDVPFFLVSDITNTGGVFQIFDKAKPIIQGSNVNVVAVQSLYKFFEYGWDTTSLGALIGHGHAFVAKGEGSLDERMIVALNLLNLGPGISEFALMPPLNSDYIQYRAKRITRNTSVILNILKEKIGNNIELSHPSLRTEEIDRAAFVEFLGPYFFIKMPDEASASKVEKFIKAQTNEHLGYIDYGSSFGYDTTRLERFGDIIRVSTGTEDICHITFTAYRLSQMLRDALE